MRRATLHATPHYTLTSWGNGTAYELRHIASDQSVFVQGDDAAQFADEMADLENYRPDWSTDQVLGEMFSTYFVGA